MLNQPNSTGDRGRLGTAVCARMNCSTKQLLKVVFSLQPLLQDLNGGHSLQTEHVNPSQTSNSTVIYDAKLRKEAPVYSLRV